MYEPSVEAAQHIRSFILPHFSQTHADVELVEVAMSDTQGTMTFYEEPGCGESSSLLKVFSLENAVARQVAVTTLDDEFKLRSITHVDMLKIDAEGYDLHVLRGAQKSLERGLIDVVQFEYNAPWARANSTLHEALEIFRKNQYSVFLLRAGGLVKFDYEVYGEFYHYSNFAALSPQALARLAMVVPE
jgi:FkbM family methyltransferase